MIDELEITYRNMSRTVRQPTLLLVAGAGKLSTHFIAKDRLILGREQSCDVSIRHASVSRRHARVSVGPPLTVQDLGSTNGTQIAREIHIGGEPVPLLLGESFRIGALSCVMLDGAHDIHSPSGLGDAIHVEDPTIDRVPTIVRTIAASTASVFVLGETGVGKEVLAQTIHQLSERTGPYLKINCAAIAESLLESELFGHEKGAFTGAATQKLGLLESACGGTVLFDEIGDLAPTLQAKLLRVLETSEITRVGAVQPVPIDVRFIAATHRDLVSDVAAGRFRADLYYRLDGVSLLLPPLRARTDQIIPLALQFISAAQSDRNWKSAATADFLACLENHDWPGNVRELKATVERAVLIAAGADLTPSHLMFSRRVRPPSPTQLQLSAPSIPLELSPVALIERARIVEALDACAGNQTRAAKQLGVSRATLSAKLALYRIPRPRT